ncbi:MZB1 protein, partial [Eudromia elegans]|nr:MZB1 protein [Eudromia elegans]
MQPLLTACMALSVLAPTEAEEPCGGGPVRSASAPRLSAEEAYSAHMPAHLRCDACRAIAFQIREHLARAEAKRSPGRQAGAELRESEYMEVLERSCTQSWDGYGVMEVQGVKRLAGPGLPSQEPMMVLVSGGPWPGRLHKMCHGRVGELGEERLYRAHRRGAAALEQLLCHGAKGACAAGPAPAQVPQTEL